MQRDRNPTSRPPCKNLRSRPVSTPAAKTVTVPEKLSAELLCTYDENLGTIEKNTNVRVAARGAEIHLSGAPRDVERAERLIQQMVEVLESGHSLRNGAVGL